MTILAFFSLNIPIRRLWANLYHKEDHFLKIWPLLHYFSEIYLKICDFALFFQKIFFAHSKRNMSFRHLGKNWASACFHVDIRKHKKKIK